MCLPQEESQFGELGLSTGGIKTERFHREKKPPRPPKAQKGTPKIPVSVMSRVISLTYSDCDADRFFVCFFLELCSVNRDVNYKTTVKN